MRSVALMAFAASTKLELSQPMRSVRVFNAPHAPTWSAVQKLRVMTWNVQYAASIRQHFFYDGGRAVSAPREDVEFTLRGLVRAIRAADPDVVMLQEVDRGSRRTCGIDQLMHMLEDLDFCSHASAPYWRVPYVPHPRHEHLGRIDMHLVTLSKYRLDSAMRIQLPLLQESRVRRLFNLRRAVLDVALPRAAAGAPVRLLNTHLSAFSGGDGALRSGCCAMCSPHGTPGHAIIPLRQARSSARSAYWTRRWRS